MTTNCRALSLLEVMIASAILVGVAGLAVTSLSSGSSLQRTISARTDADDEVARLVHSLAKELRLADIIALDVPSATATSAYYTFRIATGVNTTTPQTMEQVITYGTEIRLAFVRNDDEETGTLTRSERPAGTSTWTASRVLSDHLAWSYTTTTGETSLGFSIAQINSSTTMIGDRIQISAASRPNLPAPAITVSSESIVDGGTRAQPFRYAPLTSTATVQLRSSMFDGFGVTPPEITSDSIKEGNLGTMLRYDIIAKHYPTSYGAGSLPPGLSCQDSTGMIAGIPTSTGTWTSTIQATNAAGSDLKTVIFTIRGAIPAFTSASSSSLVAGSSWSYQLEATNSPTSYSVTNLPSGLSFNSSLRTISGTVTTEGTYVIGLAATNYNGTGTASLTLTVAPIPPPPPVITSPVTSAATVGSLWSYQIQATNSPSSFFSTGLPSGFSLNGGNGLITGTPSDTGTWTIGLQATNAAGSGTAVLTLTVTTRPVPAITSATSANATVGTAFTYTVTATNSPTSYSAAGLPSWLQGPTSTGLLYGTPTDSDTGSGTSTITATNANGSGSANLTWTVAARPAPVITSVLSSTGTVGAVYSYTISASNSPTSYGAGGLPAGLTVSSTTGTISGTPTTAGDARVTLSASNGGGTGTATLTLTIGQAVPAPIVTLGSNSGSGSNFQVLGTVAAGAGATLDTSSFAVQANPSSYAITLKRGWISGEAGRGSNALGPNEFLIAGSRPSGSLTLTASIRDTGGRPGSASRTY